MHGTAVLEIAGQEDMGVAELLAQPGELLVDGVEIEQRLAGVLAGTIAAVDHRYMGGCGKLGHRALVRMAHHDGIAVTAHYPAGVVERFALGHRGEGKAGGVAYTAAESAKGSVETDPGGGTGFEEEVAEYRAFQHTGYLAAAGDGLHARSDMHQVVDAVAGQGIDGE